MSNNRRNEYYEAVDPFKPSVAFSLRKLFGKQFAGEGLNTENMDDLLAQDARRLPAANRNGRSSSPINGRQRSRSSSTGRRSTIPSSWPPNATTLAAHEPDPDSQYRGRTSPPPALSRRSSTTIQDSVNKSYDSTLASGQTFTLIIAVLIDTIPRQIYLYLLFRLPALYFTRVASIFEEAEMTIQQIKKGIVDTARHRRELLPQIGIGHDRGLGDDSSSVGESYRNLNKSWMLFIDSLMKEWKTFNIISVLLLSAILTVLQFDGVEIDPLARFAAFISMICALMSLLFGCIYIIRFGTMRKTHKAAAWAAEAKATTTGIFWNVWVMLAMPASWLAWSMISFIFCVMSFVWRTGTDSDINRQPMSDEQALAPRILVTVVLSLGLLYFCLIVMTLRRYGSLMDRAWERSIQEYISKSTNPANEATNGNISAVVQTSNNRPAPGPSSNEKKRTYDSTETSETVTNSVPQPPSYPPTPSSSPAMDKETGITHMHDIDGTKMARTGDEFVGTRGGPDSSSRSVESEASRDSDDDDDA